MLSDSVNRDSLDIAGDFNIHHINNIKPLNKLAIEDAGISFIGFNTLNKNSVFYSLNARKAIASGLDIPKIMKVAGIAGVQASQIVPQLLPGYDPAIKNSIYDPVKVKQSLLNVQKINKPEILYYPGGDDPQANEIVKELNTLGFNISGQAVDDFDTFVNNAISGQYDMYYLADGSNLNDGLQLYSDLLSSQSTSNYSNPQVDDLINQVTATLDPTTRINKMKQIAVINDQDKPIIPLYTQNRLYSITKPYVITADMPGLSNSVYYWKVHKE